MAGVMMALAFGKMALGIAGTRNADKAQQAQAKQDAAGLRYEADVLDQRAGQERAVSHVKAEEEQRKARRLLSRQRAMGAASGAGVGGDLANIMELTAAKGRYNSDLELWQGESTARGTEQTAKMKRYGADATLASDKARRKSMPLQYASQVVSGAADVYSAGSGTYWNKPGGDSDWSQTTRNANDDVIREETFSTKYRYG